MRLSNPQAYPVFNQKRRPYKQNNIASKGFTIIELMIVIVIIATLSAIAIPSFRNYTARAKVTEALSALTIAKLDIAEQYLNNAMPDNNYAIASVTTKIVQSISYTQQDNNHAYLTVALQNLGAGLDDGLSFSLFARGSDFGIEWDCALSPADSNPISADFLPSQCKDGPPDISDPDSYLD